MSDETKFDGLTTDDLYANLTAAVDRVQYLENEMDSGRLVGRPEAILLLAAKVAHEVNRAYCESLGDDSQVPWDEAPEWQKASCLSGVRAVAENPSLTPEMSHVLWCKHKKDDGWIHGSVKDADDKTHPCLVPYSDLPKEQQVKDSLFGAAVRAVLCRGCNGVCY